MKPKERLQICEVMWSWSSRFRDRWYSLSTKRVLDFIEKVTREELKIISARCGALASELGYEVPFSSEKVK